VIATAGQIQFEIINTWDVHRGAHDRNIKFAENGDIAFDIDIPDRDRADKYLRGIGTLNPSCRNLPPIDKPILPPGNSNGNPTSFASNTLWNEPRVRKFEPKIV
jgi:hypothetical protein